MSKTVIVLLVVLLTGAAAYLVVNRKAAAAKEGETFAVTLTDQEWQAKLSPAAYKVLRQEATERPNTSPLNKEKRPGAFRCAGCDIKLFETQHKFDSGTGWPSFFQPGDANAVATRTDYKIGVPRTEVHCANCGGHLGHVFGDGPAPTGKRYCINGVSLQFTPEKEPQ